jgi:hypothetical protein
VLNINVNGRDLNQLRTTSFSRKERQRPSAATSEVKKVKEVNLTHKKEHDFKTSTLYVFHCRCKRGKGRVKNFLSFIIPN